MKNRKCQNCGRGYRSNGNRAAYCGDVCRQRACRARKATPLFRGVKAVKAVQRDR